MEVSMLDTLVKYPKALVVPPGAEEVLGIIHHNNKVQLQETNKILGAIPLRRKGLLLRVIGNFLTSSYSLEHLH